MKKLAKEIKKGDKISVSGEIVTVQEVEVSDIGKQGSPKCRILALKKNGEKIALIRPSDYPFDVS